MEAGEGATLHLTILDSRPAAKSERAEKLAKGAVVARETLKLAVEAEGAHEKLSPSKPRAAAKPAKTK